MRRAIRLNRLVASLHLNGFIFGNRLNNEIHDFYNVQTDMFLYRIDDMVNFK